MKIASAVAGVIFSAAISSAVASETSSGSDLRLAWLPTIGNVIKPVELLPPVAEEQLPMIPIGGGGGRSPIDPIVPVPLPIPGKP